MSTSGYGDERAAIFGHLESQWMETPIEFPNTKFKADGKAHVTARIRNQTAFNSALGNREQRRPGLLVLIVRVPKNEGDGRAIDYGTQLADLFENLHLHPRIHFRAATVRDLGPDADGYYVVQVECPFYRNSIH